MLRSSNLKGGGCTLRNNSELLDEALNTLKSNYQEDSSNTAKPKEVYYTVQVASLAKEDKGKLKNVPDLFYLRSKVGNYKYSSGKFSELVEAQQRKNTLRTQGFADAYVVAYRDGIPVSFKEAEIALNYLQEGNTTTNQPENQNLIGEELVNHPQVKSEISAFLKEMNKDLAPFEQIKKPELILEPWTVEGGELTPKMSMRRKVILKKHEDLFRKIYAEQN